ncbi:hypothetical protein O9992_03090 [Vibrio lentus]|nr:hypothetical protein [Vibrio lentus]
MQKQVLLHLTGLAGVLSSRSSHEVETDGKHEAQLGAGAALRRSTIFHGRNYSCF